MKTALARIVEKVTVSDAESRSAYETMKRLLSYLLLLPIYFLPEVHFAHDFPFVQIYSYLFSICS